MKIYIIAQVVKGKEVIGYRLIDVDNNNQVSNFPLNNIKTVLGNPKTANVIANAKLVNGEVVGTNGQLSRYAKIDIKGNLVGDSPLVVLNKIDDVGYTVSDFKGQVKRMKNSDVVAYAKQQGIANGKVVTQDNIDYISSISDSYEQLDVKALKIKATAPKCNCGCDTPEIHKNAKQTSIAKNAKNDVEVELEYSDAFNSLTDEQSIVIKDYYAWYTEDSYKRLVSNTRLEINPNKAEKLAQLRGSDNWVLASINDSLFDYLLDKTYVAKCALGHRIRYEYIAMPEDEFKKIKDKADMRYIAQKYESGKSASYNYKLKKKARVDYYKENEHIIFGERCAGDFFNIRQEDMKKLLKVRKEMTEEINILADVTTNNLQEEYINKHRLLTDCLNDFGKDKVLELLGENLGYTALNFMAVGLPFTKSLVILIGNKIRENKIEFLKMVNKDYTHIVDLAYAGRNLPKNEFGADYENLQRVLHIFYEYIVDFGIEGDYRYDPINDDSKSRRDIGAYNKQTRYERGIILDKLHKAFCLNHVNMNYLETIRLVAKYCSLAMEVCERTMKYLYDNKVIYNKFFTGRAIDEVHWGYILASIDSYVKGDWVKDSGVQLESKGSYGYRTSDSTGLPYFDTVIACANIGFGRRGYYGNLLNYKTEVSSYTNYSGKKELSLFSSRYKYFKSMSAQLDKYLVNTGFMELMQNTIDYFIKYVDKSEKQKAIEQEKENEKRKNVVIYAGYWIKETTDLFKKYGNVVFTNTTNGEDYDKIKELVDAGNPSDPNHLDIEMDEGFVVNTNDIVKMKELSYSIYEMKKYALKDIKLNEEREKKYREELVAEASKTSSETENKETEADDKMRKLAKLLEGVKDNKDDYGLKVARSIVSKHSTYDELSSKQKWRVDQTLIQLGDAETKDEVENNENYNTRTSKNTLADNKEVSVKVKLLLDILENKDIFPFDKMYEKVADSSIVAFDIAKTVKEKGEYSEKQLKYIEKAINSIKQ